MVLTLASLWYSGTTWLCVHGRGGRSRTGVTPAAALSRQWLAHELSGRRIPSWAGGIRCAHQRRREDAT